MGPTLDDPTREDGGGGAAYPKRLLDPGAVPLPATRCSAVAGFRIETGPGLVTPTIVAHDGFGVQPARLRVVPATGPIRRGRPLATVGGGRFRRIDRGVPPIRGGGPVRRRDTGVAHRFRIRAVPVPTYPSRMAAATRDRRPFPPDGPEPPVDAPPDHCWCRPSAAPTRFGSRSCLHPPIRHERPGRRGTGGRSRRMDPSHSSVRHRTAAGAGVRRAAAARIEVVSPSSDPSRTAAPMRDGRPFSTDRRRFSSIRRGGSSGGVRGGRRRRRGCPRSGRCSCRSRRRR